jgi:CubicO group peptidase (beta-lactamase class C family)
MTNLAEFPVSVLAMAGDKVIAESTAPGCEPGTRFQLASVSKQFTAAAVLVLAERGAVALDDPIGTWVGGCPPSWTDITVHHLLAHTSGLGHWHDYPMIDLTAEVEPEALLRTFGEVPPLSPAGDRWYYSSPGYVLLAHVAQRAADLPYAEALEKLIFGPLGLERTFAGSPGERGDVAVGLGTDGRPVPSFALDVVGTGAGDVWSTTRDVVAWIDGLRAGRLLGERYRTLMLTEHAATEGRPLGSGYGYGWFVGEYAGEPWFQHSGDNAGFRSFDAWLPRSDRRLAILSNSETVGMDSFERMLAAILG